MRDNKKVRGELSSKDKQNLLVLHENSGSATQKPKVFWSETEPQIHI